VIRLWPFRGGVHLDTQKAVSSVLPLADADLPSRLVFPLLQRGGENAQPVVSVGERVLKGQVIARGADSPVPPIHASSSGLIESIRPLPLPHPSGLCDWCIVIETDGRDEAVEMTGTADYRTLSPRSLRGLINEAGIVGLGGAGFPTAVKLDPPRSVDTLILNGAECEPYITCDDSLLRHFPQEVLEGARILMHILGVPRCLLGIEDNMPEAIAALRSARQRDGRSAIEVVPVPSIYPTGGEKQLIQLLTGREVPAHGIPADAGVVCHNVGTAAAAFRAVVRGEPLISRIVTVTGRGVRQPRNLSVRIGTPIADLVRQCGGYSERAERLVLGGPMMGFSLASDDLPIVKGANCILVAAAGELPSRGQTLPCIRCGACADICPVNLLPQQLYWYSRARNLERAGEHQLLDCIECGCCDTVCPSHIPLAQTFRAAKSQVIANGRERERAHHARARFEARLARKDEQRREQAEAAKRKREALSKPNGGEIARAIERARARKQAASPSQVSGSAHGSPGTVIQEPDETHGTCPVQRPEPAEH